MRKLGEFFTIWKLIISFFSNSLRHSLISELWRRLFEKREIVNFYIKKIPLIGTTFNIEMYGIWYNSDTRYKHNTCNKLN